MPVILTVPQDPTDLVITGEQMRTSVMDASVVFGSCMIDAPVGAFSSLVPDEDAYAPMNSFVEINRLSIRRMRNGQLALRVNAGIVTPCGAWVWLDYTPLINTFEQATNRFVITGQTKDSGGAALGNCRVVCLEMGRMAVASCPMVAETYSDGSGNYSVEVPLDTGYELIAYKPGSPDVAGITRNDVVPVHNA